MSADDRSPATRDRTEDERSTGIAWRSYYLAFAGVVLLAGAAWAIVEGSDTAAATLVVLGGGACILAPFASDIEGTLKLGALEVPIRRRVVSALAKAKPRELAAVTSILESKDVGAQVISLPSRYSGQTLKDGEDLSRWRPDRDLSVIGVRARDGDAWTAGGQITEMELREGMDLLVIGPPAELDRLRNE